MRLMIVGTLLGYITEAGRIALDRGARVTHAESIDQALNGLRSGKGADLVMVDVKLDVAKLVEALKTERIAVPVVACGIGTDTQAAVRAIRSGAKEYIPLPPDAQLIAAVLEAVSEETNAVVFRDAAMRTVLQLADQIAPADATVLITGESGTGKEVVARYIHRKSRRAQAPFVSINCAAIPEALLESELFGHEKGAFTGAIARRLGKFEEANGGTLLLDEVSEMHPRLQAKLLRAVQEREIDRIGGTSPVKVDIRLIATSNRDLEAEVRAGNFREDLYYRLNVVNLMLPPLRQRPNDIPALAEYFARKYAQANGHAPKTLTPESLEKLATHIWRGNVRELENTMHRAVLLSPGEAIEASAILITGQPQAGGPIASPVSTLSNIGASPSPIPAPVMAGAAQPRQAAGAQAPMAAAGLIGRTVAEVERDLILGTLTHTFGNRTHAANILGISIRTLRNKLKEYSESGIRVPMPGEGERATY